jgi:predicted extracellular nuclease
MRVEVNDPLVVAGTNQFDEVTLAANRGGESGPDPVNAVVSEGDFNPEILLTDDILVTEPDATTGDTFAANPVGVLDYTFGAYKLQLTETPGVVAGGRTPDVASLVGDTEHMTIATYNVLNLNPSAGSPGGAPDRLDALAQSIVDTLGAPDIIALQEVQDDSGETDDGVVDASATLTALTEAIALAGGPSYEFAQISPDDNEDGGAPGANIRNAFLYDPARVSLDAASLARIEDDAFDAGGDGSPAEAAYQGTRKPLVGEFTFLPTGEVLTVIGNHLKSKSEDDGLYGENQPPVEHTLAQRVDQARVINEHVAGILSADPEANVIALGDMNDFQFSDTLAALANSNGGAAELTNLVDSLPTEEQYSFIFNGNSQLLDHILASDNIQADAPEVDAVHANLDFGSPLDTASDHDPVVARLDLSDAIV